MSLSGSAENALLDSLVAPLQLGKPPSFPEASEQIWIDSDTYQGNYSYDIVPYMRKPCESMTSRRYKSVIFAGPARSGKSQALLDNAVYYNAKIKPSDFMVVFPSKTAGKKFSIKRVDNMIRANMPEFMAPGADSNQIHLKQFKSGNCLYLSWPSPGELALIEVKWAGVTDLDRIVTEGQEGSVFKRMKKRTQTFLSRAMAFAESSPSMPITDPSWVCPEDTPHMAPPVSGGIMQLYNQGTRNRWHWLCPECGHGFRAEWDCLSFTQSDNIHQTGQSTVIVCKECGSAVEGNQKSNLNKSGLWVPCGMQVKEGQLVGRAPETDVDSYWLHGPAAAFMPVHELVTEYLKAEATYSDSKEESALTAFWNVDNGTPYLPKSQGTARKASDYQEMVVPAIKGQVPNWAQLLIATIDLHKHSFIVQVHAIGKYWKWQVIDRFDIDKYTLENGAVASVRSDTSSECYQQIKSQVIDRTYPVAGSDEHMKVLLTLSDSAGVPGTSSKVEDFAKDIYSKPGYSEKFILVKGASKISAPMINETQTDKKKVRLLTINTVELKDMAISCVGSEGNYECILPDWLPSSWFDEWVCETRTDKGYHRPAGKPNEALDLVVYMLTGIKWLIRHKNSNKPVDWDHPPWWATQDNNLIRARGLVSPIESFQMDINSSGSGIKSRR